MKTIDIDKIDEIIKFTFRGSFDTLELSRYLPESVSGEQPFVIIEGVKAEYTFRLQYYYHELISMYESKDLNKRLLKDRDNVFKQQYGE